MLGVRSNHLKNHPKMSILGKGFFILLISVSFVFSDDDVDTLNSNYYKTAHFPDVFIGPVFGQPGDYPGWGLEFTLYDIMSMTPRGMSKHAYRWGFNFEICGGHTDRIVGLGFEYMVWNKILGIQTNSDARLFGLMAPNPQIMWYYSKNNKIHTAASIFIVGLPTFIEYDFTDKKYRIGMFLKFPVLLSTQ